LGTHIFLYKSLFARDLNTYTSVPESTKIVPDQPIYMQNTRCARGHVATSSGDGRCSSEKIVTKEKAHISIASESAPTLSACYAASANPWKETIWESVPH
jgi:hypothetical protein